MPLIRHTGTTYTYTYADVIHRLDLLSCRCGRCAEHAVFYLASGDAVWNPASTQRLIYGPGRVEFTRYPDGGINVAVYDLNHRGAMV